MKTTLLKTLLALGLLLPVVAGAQVNSGSNGSDGAFNPTQNVTIDMANHPDGIYQYTSVNIPSGVTVSFIPNANNKPVVWLVQGDCTVGGTVDVTGQDNGRGGPGGFRGGTGGSNPTPGAGPGGGSAGVPNTVLVYGGTGSFGTVGDRNTGDAFGQGQAFPGQTYGNIYLLPLIGGSGGGAGSVEGSGGGGAIMIAASGKITVQGFIRAIGGGPSGQNYNSSSAGSGGAIRLVAAVVSGGGYLYAAGGVGAWGWRPGSGGYLTDSGGLGRIRIDAFQNTFGGQNIGVFTQGFQPIIIPASGQGIQLSIASVGGVAAPASPSGVLANPDVIISAQQANPIPVVVNCSNIPLNTEITVKVHPANGADVTAVGINNAGTLAASTATVALNMPRGGGIIYASAVTGIAGLSSNASEKDLKTKSLAETGWTANGERFVAMEVTASMGGKQHIAYLTKSGKRYPVQ
jgi:hypothetical protein